MNPSPNSPAAQTVTSADGTTISYTTRGTGPQLVIVTGNNRMAHDYDKLAANLAADFTVIVMERRGRGASGPQGSNYTVQHEVEDLQAILTATGAANVLGHSYGGLIALQAARTDTRIQRLIAYEPAVSINGSYDISWLPQFQSLLSAHKPITATVTFLKKSRLTLVSAWPTPLLYALAFLLLQGKSGQEMRAMMPSAPAEIRAVGQTDSDGSPYRSITAATILLGGENGAPALLAVLPQLQTSIPHATYAILPKLNHNGPDLGPVEPIAQTIRQHLSV